jgi:hypothetical protein
MALHSSQTDCVYIGVGKNEPKEVKEMENGLEGIVIQLQEVVDEINALRAEARECVQAGKKPFVEEKNFFNFGMAVLLADSPAEFLRLAMTGTISIDTAQDLATLSFRLGKRHAEAAAELAALNRMMSDE